MKDDKTPFNPQLSEANKAQLDSLIEFDILTVISEDLNVDGLDNVDDAPENDADVNMAVDKFTKMALAYIVERLQIRIKE